MTTFEHFVITRFNVKLNDGLLNNKGNDPDWLTERFKLFDTFCYPSLLSQTNQRFKWIVLFDDGTPERFRERALSYVKWKNYNPEFVNFALHEETGCPPGLISIIEKHVSSNPRFLITTRIDNDDGVCKDFIRIVQNQFRSQDAEAIVFPLGYQLYQSNLHLDYSMGNHFVSLIEKFQPGSLYTVFVKPHDRLYQVAPVRKVFCRPTWLEVVHGGNIANRPNNGLVVSPGAFRSNFSVGEAPFVDDNLLRLRIRQDKFLEFGAPIYFLKKLINRMKYHGPFSMSSRRSTLKN
jgi:hypothetical protein